MSVSHGNSIPGDSVGGGAERRRTGGVERRRREPVTRRRGGKERRRPSWRAPTARRGGETAARRGGKPVARRGGEERRRPIGEVANRRRGEAAKGARDSADWLQRRGLLPRVVIVAHCRSEWRQRRRWRSSNFELGNVVAATWQAGSDSGAGLVWALEHERGGDY